MPEGHSVHRIARQFQRNFVGSSLRVSSPQGRFAASARLLDGHKLLSAQAYGKQLLLEFANQLWLQVHLGLYGAWDFYGQILSADSIQSGPQEASLKSIGAPRRLRMGEKDKEQELSEAFPPPPVGQVRVRLLAETAGADLRGPAVCQILEQPQGLIARLGPDPLVDPGNYEPFIQAVQKSTSPLGQLLMNQQVVAGIGNIYRAELLFRNRLSPFVPGKRLERETLLELWNDWDLLLRLGVQTGQMITMEDEHRRRHLETGVAQHWVYQREKQPCWVCGFPIACTLMAARKLYWCPSCQAAPAP